MLKAIEKHLKIQYPKFIEVHRYSIVLMMGQEYISVIFKVKERRKIIEKNDMILLKLLDLGEDVW